MNPITLNGKTLLPVDVPEESEDWEIFTIDGKQYLNGMGKDTPNMLMRKEPLPPGQWSILGRLNDIPECEELKKHGVYGNPLILILNN